MLVGSFLFFLNCTREMLMCQSVHGYMRWVDGIRFACACEYWIVGIWALMWIEVILERGPSRLAASALTSSQALRSNKLARICLWLMLCLQSVMCQFTAHIQQTLGLYYMAQWRNTWTRLRKSCVPICTLKIISLAEFSFSGRRQEMFFRCGNNVYIY